MAVNALTAREFFRQPHFNLSFPLILTTSWVETWENLREPS